MSGRFKEDSERLVREMCRITRKHGDARLAGGSVGLELSRWQTDDKSLSLELLVQGIGGLAGLMGRVDVVISREEVTDLIAESRRWALETGSLLTFCFDIEEVARRMWASGASETVVHFADF